MNFLGFALLIWGSDMMIWTWAFGFTWFSVLSHNNIFCSLANFAGKRQTISQKTDLCDYQLLKVRKFRHLTSSFFFSSFCLSSFFFISICVSRNFLSSFNPAASFSLFKVLILFSIFNWCIVNQNCCSMVFHPLLDFFFDSFVFDHRP